MKSMIRRFTRMRLLRSGLRRRLLNATYPLGQVSDDSFTVEVRGARISGNLRNAQDYAIYFYGAYEPYELDLIEFITSKIPNSVCFDIGCNMGQHTLVMAKRSSCVYAFDPLDSVRNIALERVKNNNLENVVLQGFGLGDEDCERDFFFDSESQNNAMGSFVEGHDPGSQSVGKLRIRKGDEFIREIGLNRLDLIKIDVERLEAMVISGLFESIAKFMPFVMFEVTNSSIGPFRDRGLLNRLIDIDYRFFEIVRGKPVLWIFEDAAVRLKQVNEITSRRASYNLLAVPQGKLGIVQSMVG